MGFFDQYEDEGGDRTYVSSAEKATLVENGTPFTINTVEFQKGQGYKGGDRYLLGITLEDEDRKLSFGTGTVDSRDRMLGAMAEFLATDGATAPVVVIEKAGAAEVLRPA